MDILIKGLEMTKGCDGCFCCSFNPISKEFFCSLTLVTLKEEWAENKPKWCTLVALPEHGRLIDADILRMKYEYGDERKKVDESPTVLEATECQ